ncbi:hypothetical protein H001_03184 [Escherichia coli UMEA 3955-1]|nr:hypothetical protein H001_03184 [Escherichia coli UMEA 3955-1]ESK23017.1 hypothetical protein G988_04682 [Escherichia coli UMEA 3693-1]
MATFIDHQKAFISLFNQTARYHKRHKVFEDFVSCSVIALENRLQFSEAREQKYLRIVSGYESKRLARTVLIFTERSDQLSRATDRVPGLPASPGYAQ